VQSRFPPQSPVSQVKEFPPKYVHRVRPQKAPLQVMVFAQVHPLSLGRQKSPGKFLWLVSEPLLSHSLLWQSEFTVHVAFGEAPDDGAASGTQITDCPPLATRSQPDPEPGVGVLIGVGS
jgi:hypothetical protein